MNKTIIVALFGAAGSGKDSIQKEIVKQSPNLFHEIISSTTRPPREYEQNGIDYIFITDKEAQANIEEGNYLEYAEFRGWTYGTLKFSLQNNKINIGVFNISGVKQLLQLPIEEYLIIPIHVLCSDKERLLRQLNREEDPDCSEICRRFKTDEVDLAKGQIDFWYMAIENEHNSLYYVAHDLLNALYEKLLLGFVCGEPFGQNHIIPPE